MRGLVADKLNLAEAGLLNVDLSARLEQRSVPSETTRELAECLEHCDRQRFAPPESDLQARERLLERAGVLMTALDRALGR